METILPIIVAICTNQGFDFQPSKRFEVRRDKDFKAGVILNDDLTGRMKVPVDARLRTSWTDFTASFEDQGEKLTLRFSNYLNLSMGELTTSKGKEQVACQLMAPFGSP